MSNYPFTIDDDVSIPPVNNNITEIGGEAINAVRDAVFAIENEIGLGASGSAGSISARLGVALDAAGNIKPSAIASMGLVTLPIYNFHIADNAQITESKLKLDFRTQDLFNYIKDLARDVNSSIGWINVTGMKLEPHIFGALYRHELAHIDVHSNSANYLKNKFNALRDNSNAFAAINDLNSELVTHQKLDGSFVSTSNITTDNGGLMPARYAHPASGVYLNTSRFNSIPQTAQDIQQFAEFIDSASIFLYGTRIQNFYSNGISRASRSSSLSLDGYGQSVVSPTLVTTYLLNGLSSIPVDNINTGDDIVEFKPSGSSFTYHTFDSQFQQIKAGDVITINYGSLQTSFIIKEKKYIQSGLSKSFYVRINGKNLLATTSGSARIDRPLYNNNKYGVLSVSAANNEFGGTPSLTIAHPRAASTLGIGFNPNLFDSQHYLLYIALYTTGHPTDGYTVLPGIDVTGNLGSTPGKYTLSSIVESTNDAFRKKGYNFRFSAFQYKGEFGITLSDPYNNASFSIVNGVVADSGLYDESATNLSFSKNVVGLFGVSGKQPPDPLGFGANGSGSASPLPQSVYLSASQAIKSTKVFTPLKRNTYYVNGTERDILALDVGQALDGYGDGYWVATIDDVTQPSLARVATKFRIWQDLTNSKLKAGKTLVAQGIDVATGDIIDYGRFIIESVAFDACPDPITDIVVYDSVHAKAATPFATLPIGSTVRLYFTSDSITFNEENSSDISSLSPIFKRHFEVLIDQNGNTFTHERSRFVANGSGNQTINGITLYGSGNLQNLSIVEVSPKLRGYNFFSSNNSINKITLNIANFTSSSGSFDGYLASYDDTNSTFTHFGPITSGRMGEVIRFYDETNIDYIDFIFEFNSVGDFTNQFMDIQLFPTLSLDKELYLLATCQLNEPNNKKIEYVNDKRQFGNISEEELSTSALDFINSGDRVLHENGLIRGFDLTNETGNPASEQIRLSGGMALVNGKLIQINGSVTSIPIVREKSVIGSAEYNINWALCVNDKSEFQSIPLLDYDSSFGTPTNTSRKFLARNPITGLTYNLDAMKFSSIINSRKDLCILYVVASTVTGSGNSATISLSITDSRKYVNDEGSNFPLKLTSDKSQGNFRSARSILNWIKFNSSFNSRAILKGANEAINTGLNLSFDSTVYLDGENNGSLTFNNTVVLGSNLILKDLSLTFNSTFSLASAVTNLMFDHCTITVDNVAAGSNVFNISSGNNVSFKDCTVYVRYTSSPEGNVFNIVDSSNIDFINTSVSGIESSEIFPGTSNQDGNMFNITNSPGVQITNCVFNGNFIKYMNIDNSSNIQLKNNTITSNHVSTTDSGWSSTDFVNSSSGLIYANIGSTALSDLVIDNCTFNFSPSSASSNRWPIISLELSSTTSALKNLVIKDCKFNNTNTGSDIILGYTDDKRPAISIVNTATSGSSTGSQPLLLNADISNNICNRNQSIIISSKTDGSGIMTYPGLNTVNCNVSGNICGTIGYWVSAGTRVNNAPTATNFNTKGSGLIIYNNDCHYIANLTGTGQFYQVSQAAKLIQNVTGTVSNPIEISTYSAHGLATGATIVISGVTGIVPSVNGTWVITNTGSTTFTLNSSAYTSGTYGGSGQIDPMNLCAYPSGHVIISHNRLNWIHAGISYEENAALTITKNILNAYDVNYVGGFGHVLSSNSGNTYHYAIAISSNYYQSTSLAPSNSNDTNVSIEGNIVNAGYYVDSNAQIVNYDYLGYVNSIGSSNIINNTFKGIKGDISNAVCISVGGLNNIITDNRIYRGSKQILAYVKFANHVLFDSTLSAASYGNITNNYFDKPTIDDSTENLINSVPDRWTYERNKNQTGFMSIPLTNGGFFTPTGAPAGSAFLFYASANCWGSGMDDGGGSYGRFGSNILRIYDYDTPSVRYFGLQRNISNYLPLNVRLVQVYSGVKPFGSVVTTTNNGTIDSMFRVFINKYKTSSTFSGSYIASNGINTPPIINMDNLGITFPNNQDTYGVENLTTNAIYSEVTGGQINSVYTTIPIYINLENYTQSVVPWSGGPSQAPSGDQSSSYITGKGYEFGFSFAMYWKRITDTNFGVAPVVIKYRW